MARRIATPEPAVEYVHKVTKETLLDVCSSLDGAVAYAEALEAAGHGSVELVEAIRRPRGRYEKIS